MNTSIFKKIKEKIGDGICKHSQGLLMLASIGFFIGAFFVPSEYKNTMVGFAFGSVGAGFVDGAVKHIIETNEKQQDGEKSQEQTSEKE